MGQTEPNRSILPSSVLVDFWPIEPKVLEPTIFLDPLSLFASEVHYSMGFRLKSTVDRLNKPKRTYVCLCYGASGCSAGSAVFGEITLRSQVFSSAGKSGLSRLINTFPTTMASMSVLRKHRIASSGVLTIGSFSFKDVFKRIGIPVFRRKLLINAWYLGLVEADTVWRRPEPSTCVTAGIS